MDKTEDQTMSKILRDQLKKAVGLHLHILEAWYCKTHGVYFDILTDRKHDECPPGPETLGQQLKYELQADEVIYYLNQYEKARAFVRALRRFIDSGGNVGNDVIIEDGQG